MIASIVVLAVALALALVGIATLLIERAKSGAALRHAQSDGAELASRAEAAAARAAEIERDLARTAADLAAAGARLDEQQTRARQAREELESRLSQQQLAFRDAIKATAQDAFRQASEQLKAASDQSLDKRHTLARSEIEARLQPIDAALKATQAKLGEIELARTGAYAGLTEQIASMSRLNTDLKRETANLYRALSKPQVRGRYGEVQLARVAELAGMRSYCDFGEQESIRDTDGKLKRPDLVVKLPNDRKIAVDAKTNIDAYLDAVEADPGTAEQHLDRFARHVAEQAEKLAKKGYWSDFQDALDFVVMFIPGDQFIDAALQRRPELLALAAEQGVILASPSTLIGLFRAIHVGWREKGLTDNANALFALGKELHERTEKVLREASKVGSSIDSAARAYNDFVGSVDARLMPTLRKFEEAGARSEKPLPELKAVEPVVRPIKSLPARSTTDVSTSHAPTGP